MSRAEADLVDQTFGYGFGLDGINLNDFVEHTDDVEFTNDVETDDVVYTGSVDKNGDVVQQLDQVSTNFNNINFSNANSAGENSSINANQTQANSSASSELPSTTFANLSNQSTFTNSTDFVNSRQHDNAENRTDLSDFSQRNQSATDQIKTNNVTQFFFDKAFSYVIDMYVAIIEKIETPSKHCKNGIASGQSFRIRAMLWNQTARDFGLLWMAKIWLHSNCKCIKFVFHLSDEILE